MMIKNKKEYKKMSSVIKPELEKLNVKLTEISEIVIGIKQRQVNIIETANKINQNLKNQIEEEITDQKCYEGSEERIKVLKERIEKSKSLLVSIKDKMQLLEKKIESNK